MKRMSASVYGQRALSALAFAFAASGPMAVADARERAAPTQAVVTTATAKNTRVVVARVVLMTTEERQRSGEFQVCKRWTGAAWRGSTALSLQSPCTATSCYFFPD